MAVLVSCQSSPPQEEKPSSSASTSKSIPLAAFDGLKPDEHLVLEMNAGSSYLLPKSADPTKARLRSSAGEEIRVDAWLASRGRVALSEGKLLRALELTSSGSRLADVSIGNDPKSVIQTNSDCWEMVCTTRTWQEWTPVLVCGANGCYTQWVLSTITETHCEPVPFPCPGGPGEDPGDPGGPWDPGDPGDPPEPDPDPEP